MIMDDANSLDLEDLDYAPELPEEDVTNSEHSE
jgi:hypothetical protein